MESYDTDATLSERVAFYYSIGDMEKLRALSYLYDFLEDCWDLEIVPVEEEYDF